MWSGLCERSLNSLFSNGALRAPVSSTAESRAAAAVPTSSTSVHSLTAIGARFALRGDLLGRAEGGTRNERNGSRSAPSAQSRFISARCTCASAVVVVVGGGGPRRFRSPGPGLLCSSIVSLRRQIRREPADQVAQEQLEEPQYRRGEEETAREGRPARQEDAMIGPCGRASH